MSITREEMRGAAHVGAILLLFAILGWATRPADAVGDVRWVGLVTVAHDDGWCGSVGWLPGVELGLRHDGVVVWREVKADRTSRGT